MSLPVRWSQHARDRAEERGVPIDPVSGYVGGASWMPDFKGSGYRLCWMPYEDRLIRVVYSVMKTELVIVSVMFENERKPK